jgi:DNA-binding MarR family transcriptional regulator
MNEERAEVLHWTLDAYRRVVRAVRHAAQPAWLGLDLSMGQLKSLLVIANREPVGVSGLALITHGSRPTASLLVDQLVQRGLVTRTEDTIDRRRCVVRLTDEGRTLVEQLYLSHPESLYQWCIQLEEAELMALAHGLRALAAAVTGMSPADRSQAVDAPGPIRKPETERRRSCTTYG